MRILSYNVNGLKSSISKGLKEHLEKNDFDIICLQELKCSERLLKLNGYYSYYNNCNIKGYSGTVVFTKIKPKNIYYDIGDISFNLEDRVITLEYDSFYLINVYVPTSKKDLERINYRMEFDEYFYKYLVNLDRLKPIIVCGDFNVDLVNTYKYALEFNNNELEEFSDFLDYGFIDTYDFLHRNNLGYTWCFNDKNRSLKYRLDYFIISSYLSKFLIDSIIDHDCCYSDHYPIILDINV